MCHYLKKRVSKMNKTRTLESIQSARAAHQSQMKKIVMLIDGEKVDNPTAVLKTECAFGKWLYAKDSNLRKIIGALFYDNLETTHAKWHNEYIRLFKIFFKDEVKQGFFSRLLGSSKVDEMEMDKAKLYFSELSTTTNELLKALDTCERRVTALCESKFT